MVYALCIKYTIINTKISELLCVCMYVWVFLLVRALCIINDKMTDE